MNDNEKTGLKDIEYYSNLVNAWFNTKLEKDKSILSISAGGLGLLVTLISTIGVNNLTELILFIIAIFLFMISIVSMISIFERNSKRLENEVANNNSKDLFLGLLDKIGSLSFSIAIIITFIIGVSVSIHSFNKKKESQVIKENKIITTTVPSNEIVKSFNDVNRMKPNPSINPTITNGEQSNSTNTQTQPSNAQQSQSKE